MRTIIVALLLVSIASAAPRAETLVVDGRQRTYSVHIPDVVRAAGRPAPLVIVLHGGMGSGSQMQGWLGMDGVADRHGFVVASPDGVGRSWNDGRAVMAARSGQRGADDVAYLVQLARTIAATGVVDEMRIFVTGASNGGMMAYRLACETRGVFAGYAAMIANLSTDLAGSCRPAGPVRMLMINGTADPLMPHQGGAVARDRGSVVSTAATFEVWRKTGLCRGAHSAEAVPKRGADDGTRIEITRASGCASDADVVLYSVIGGGHTLPSMTRTSRPVLERFLGKTNKDVEAAEVVWTFFARR